MDPSAGEQLIHALLADPETFKARGDDYQLLQQYFAGLPLETLRPLLRSKEILVQQAAVYVASELGPDAGLLLDDVMLLLSSHDRFIRFHAMEVIAVCTQTQRFEDFAHVVQELESDDAVLRVLAMYLMSRVTASQLEGAHDRFAAGGTRAGKHHQGLATLLSADRVDPELVRSMIRDSDPLVRRYGAIAAKRAQRFAAILGELGESEDADLREFHRQVVAP